ncbi:MAG: rhomboid family intramembrane serine protease [Spirochaetes bacterium]|nr:rhomboid family intramembrane serine protease [Spirochaetota bacterium]
MNGQYRYQISFGYRLTPAVKWLIIINAAVYFLQMILRFNPLLEARFIYLFGLVPNLVNKYLMLWQFGTYLFLHGSFLHIFVNMFALWMFGSQIESAWGSKGFLKYYFITGLGAGLASYLLSFHSPIPTIGASGSIYGILIAFAFLYPDRKILLFFILPVRAITVVLLYGVLEFFGSLQPGSMVSHVAHLGGMVIGMLYLLLIKRIPFPDLFSGFKKILKRIRLKQLEKEYKKMQDENDQDDKPVMH